MKMRQCSKLMAVAALFFSAQVLAETCEIQITRTACAGKEDISYKKCDGNQSCSEFVEVTSADECGKAATQACANQRLDITKSKVITAKYEDQAIKTASGKEDFCTDYANVAAEFNKCP